MVFPLHIAHLVNILNRHNKIPDQFPQVGFMQYVTLLYRLLDVLPGDLALALANRVIIEGLGDPATFLVPSETVNSFLDAVVYMATRQVKEDDYDPDDIVFVLKGFTVKKMAIKLLGKDVIYV